jgi:hypothetical protein
MGFYVSHRHVQMVGSKKKDDHVIERGDRWLDEDSMRNLSVYSEERREGAISRLIRNMTKLNYL